MILLTPLLVDAIHHCCGAVIRGQYQRELFVGDINRVPLLVFPVSKSAAGHFSGSLQLENELWQLLVSAI